MRIAVCVKQVKSVGDEIEFIDDGTDVDPDYLERALNEWDACAVEEAIRIRERLGAGEVIVVTVGDAGAEAALRRCLLWGPTARFGSTRRRSTRSRLRVPSLAFSLGSHSDLVLAGAQSADAVQGATGVALAELLELPRVAVVTQIDWAGSGLATVNRELEGGLL